jgi:ABC-type transporter Mla MlaB component
MLRITRILVNDSTATLKLEGKLVGPWVEVVRRACGPGPGGASLIRLDLSEVSYVDPAGATLLRDLLRQGIVLAACSGFVAALLHVESS